eukprot:SAG31_NODE_1690_length_7524_cov_2.991919_1_plen_136_part_00
MRLATAQLLLIAPPPSAAGACPNDCELNGACVGSVCHCDPQWYGPSCGQLRLEPTTRDSGYRGGGDGSLSSSAEPVSTWGGSIAGPDGRGLYHMFAARMTYHCGLLSWKTNSEVVHAVSSAPLGKKLLSRFCAHY